MLAVQKYLKSGKTPEDLTKEFGIKINYHPTEPIFCCSYDQLESPKMHPIVMECRGLVLETTSYNIVAHCMRRFFNHGEACEITDKFDWTDGVECRSKEDGSLMTLFFYNGEWRVKTRNSWADSVICENGPKWDELFFSLLLPESMDRLFSREDTYVFEMCSMWNQVVRQYHEPKLFLLTILNNNRKNREDSAEYHSSLVDRCAQWYGLERPAKINSTSIDDVREYISNLEESDGTAEGLVLKDKNGLRIKVKSKTYLAYSRLGGNGNVALTKNLIPLILANEQDEAVAIFPSIKDRVDELQLAINGLFSDLAIIHASCEGIEDQKEFALLITKQFPTPFSSVLFGMKRDGVIGDVDELRKRFRAATPLLLKVLDN